MSSFAVRVHRIHLEKHPAADRLMLGSIEGMDYRFIVGNHYSEGSLGFYVPTGGIVPHHLLQEMELLDENGVGKLAGPDHNRVRAIRLRGVISEGLWYGGPSDDYPTPSWNPAWQEGDDVTEEVGIVKWEPPVPVQMQGKAKVRPVGPERDFWHKYDMENIKHSPDLFADGECVVATEKLHGTLCLVGVINGEEVVSSKGLAKDNLVLEESAENVYWRAARAHGLFDKLRTLGRDALLFGEVLGVQHLMYGLTKGQIAYRAFDLYVGADAPHQTGFYSDEPFRHFCDAQDIPRVPVLYTGRFDRAALEAVATGPSTLAGHVREGAVIKPVWEKRDKHGDRAIVKMINPDYLLSRDKEMTEYT